MSRDDGRRGQHLLGVDVAGGEPVLSHRAPWNPQELHLGPADDCWTCGTMEGSRQQPEDDGDPGFGLSVGLVLGLLLWAVICFAISWWWWSL